MMTKEEARAYVERWEAVKAIEVEEQRAASVSQRLRQLVAIHNLARGLGLRLMEQDREEEVVRERWAKLKGLSE